MTHLSAAVRFCWYARAIRAANDIEHETRGAALAAFGSPPDFALLANPWPNICMYKRTIHDGAARGDQARVSSLPVAAAGIVAVLLFPFAPSLPQDLPVVYSFLVFHKTHAERSGIFVCVRKVSAGGGPPSVSATISTSVCLYIAKISTTTRPR